MVTLSQVQATNARVAKDLPPNMVGVFAGATTGIGSTALLAFAKYSSRPRIYFIGRADEPAKKLIAQMEEDNPEGEYVFLKKDLSLMANVDEVCKEIARREKQINILFMSQGTVKSGETSEGLPYITAVQLYSRIRMANNLLPLVQQASTLRRVISVAAGTYAGRIYINDIPGRKVPFRHARGHLASAMTLSMDALQRKAPEVSFIHNYPGAIDTELIRPESGLLMQPLKYIFWIMFWGKFMSYDECGERHAYLCVSGMYPPKGQSEGLSFEKGLGVAKGLDGKVGSGLYAIDAAGEQASEEQIKVIEKHRADGYVDKVWQHMESEFKRITGSPRMQ